MIYLFAADGFEESELIVPLDMLRRAGLETQIAGVTGLTVTGGHGVKIQADLPVEAVDPDRAELLVLPGGGVGTQNLRKSREVAQILTKAAYNNTYIAAICAAPTVLGGLGLLKDRRFTCYPGCEVGLEGEYTGAPAETSGTIITGKAAGTAYEFGAALITALRGRAAADRVLGEIYKV